MLRFRIDVLSELKKAGVTQANAKISKVLSQAAFGDMRKGKVPGIHSIESICSILKCQPGELIEWVPDSCADICTKDTVI